MNESVILYDDAFDVLPVAAVKLDFSNLHCNDSAKLRTKDFTTNKSQTLLMLCSTSLITTEFPPIMLAASTN